MKPTKAPKNKEHVTALIGEVELTIYAENGDQANRRHVKIGIIQAGIPAPVRTWLMQIVRTAETKPKEG